MQFCYREYQPFLTHQGILWFIHLKLYVAFEFSYLEKAN